jgi:hypothetical protein
MCRRRGGVRTVLQDIPFPSAKLWRRCHLIKGHTLTLSDKRPLLCFWLWPINIPLLVASCALTTPRQAFSGTHASIVRPLFLCFMGLEAIFREADRGPETSCVAAVARRLRAPPSGVR